MTDDDAGIETVSQLRAVEIAGNLQRISHRLRVPSTSPQRLRDQLLRAQRDVIATLIDLNSVIGGPAPLPATRQGEGAAATH